MSFTCAQTGYLHLVCRQCKCVWSIRVRYNDTVSDVCPVCGTSCQHEAIVKSQDLMDMESKTTYTGKSVELPHFGKPKKFEFHYQYKLGLVTGIVLGMLLVLLLMNIFIRYMPFSSLLKLLSIILV